MLFLLFCATCFDSPVLFLVGQQKTVVFGENFYCGLSVLIDKKTIRGSISLFQKVMLQACSRIWKKA